MEYVISLIFPLIFNFKLGKVHKLHEFALTVRCSWIQSRSSSLYSMRPSDWSKPNSNKIKYHMEGDFAGEYLILF